MMVMLIVQQMKFITGIIKMPKKKPIQLEPSKRSSLAFLRGDVELKRDRYKENIKKLFKMNKEVENEDNALQK